VADVRSSPYSRFNPQFNRQALESRLSKTHIAYVFLGEQLGARPHDLSCYRNGKVAFDLLASRPFFREGLDRIRHGASKFNVALLCAERDPIFCHRMILVCRHLRSPDTTIRHILDGGAVEDNSITEKRLIRHLRAESADFFKSPTDILEEAYDLQGQHIAYQEERSDKNPGVQHE
jgi:uncharacterized protein (DUF488 family)